MAESSETWRKDWYGTETRPGGTLLRVWAVYEGRRRIAGDLSEEDADRIILDHALARLASRYAEALRTIGRCTRCQGSGLPQCVTCDDYQYCRCRPGEGKYADKCWACKGTGIMSQTARDALSIPEQDTTEETA